MARRPAGVLILIGALLIGALLIGALLIGALLIGALLIARRRKSKWSAPTP